MKYFRNLKYKQRLETKYNNSNHHTFFNWTGIEFYTKELDPYQDNEWQDKIYEEHGHYIYYNRPSVPYTIHQVQYWAPRGGQTSTKKWYKKYSNKQVRRSKNSYQRGQYKKVFDLWWTLY